MPNHRIVCVNTEHPHSHITLVGTGTAADTYSRTWTVKEVRTALENGDRFYTVSASTGKEADVRADNCNVNGCIVPTIRSKADAVTDNNLDNMRGCAL
jgi:Protein of unknown function (DUF3892)